jgi:hypothetical protein
MSHNPEGFELLQKRGQDIIRGLQRLSTLMKSGIPLSGAYNDEEVKTLIGSLSTARRYWLAVKDHPPADWPNIVTKIIVSPGRSARRQGLQLGPLSERFLAQYDLFAPNLNFTRIYGKLIEVAKVAREPVPQNDRWFLREIRRRKGLPT